MYKIENDNADLNDISNTIHASCKSSGWWDGERNIFLAIQLISTEIAEATEGERKQLMDDHLPHRKMGEVELADALIRTLDLMGYFKVELCPTVLLMTIFEVREIFIDRKIPAAECHFWINAEISALGIAYARDQMLVPHFSRLVANIIATADHLGYGIYPAMREKFAYNQSRADHTREARAADGGKKF